MEQKRIIAVGVEGKPPQVPAGEGIIWLPFEGAKGAVLFGFPQRAEDDAERALRTTCANLTSESRFAVKEVSVELDADAIHLDWRQAFAPDLRTLNHGDAIVSPSLAKIFDRLFLFEKVEEDGKELFFLRGERGRPTRLRGLKPAHAPIVGRQKEFQRLVELLEQIAVDQGQIAGIIGEAGIGKTRLTVALKEHLQEKRILFAEGVYQARESHRPYSGIAEIVSRLVGGKIETLSQWAMTDVETDFLRLFLEPGIKIDRLAGLSEKEIREGLFHAVRKLIHSAANQPLVLIVEDLHWADEASIDLLERIMEGMESTRLLIVLVHRPDLEIRWKKRLNYNRILLSPLSVDEVDHFLATSTGVDRVAARVRDDLFKLSVGNPLFAEELLRQLLDTGGLEVEKGDDGKKLLRAKETKYGNVPPTLHSLIASRFDRLHKTTREILRWASLLGSSFDAPELEGIVAQEIGPDTKENLQELFEKGYLVEQSVYPKTVYRFAHDLILDVVLESLTKKDRRQRHTILTKFLAKKYDDQIEWFTDRIADHALQSDDDLAAIDWAMKAGERNSSLFNYPLAERYFRRAIERWREMAAKRPNPHPIFEQWIRTLATCGNYETAKEALKEWEGSGVVGSAAEGDYCLVAAALYRATYEHQLCVEFADKAIATFQITEGKRLEAIEHRLNALQFLGRGKELIHEGLKLLKQLDIQKTEARFRIWSRLAFYATQWGDMSQGLDYLKKADALSGSNISPADRVDFHTRYAEFLLTTMAYDAPIDHLNRALKTARDAGMMGQATRILSSRGEVYQYLGKYKNTFADLEHALLDAQLLKDEASELAVRLALVEFYLDLAAVTEAKEFLKIIDVKFLANLTTVRKNMMQNDYAQIALHEDNPQQAAKLYRQMFKTYSDLGNRGVAGTRLASALSIEALYKLRSPEELAIEYNELEKATRHVNLPIPKLRVWMTALDLAASGIAVPLPEINLFRPSQLKSSWYKQLAYISLIRFLKSRDQRDEANKLILEYQSLIKEMLKEIPLKYHQLFLSHKQTSLEANGLI